MEKGLQSDCALPARKMAPWSLPLASVKSAKTSSASLARMHTVRLELQNRTPWKMWPLPSSTILEEMQLKDEKLSMRVKVIW